MTAFGSSGNVMGMIRTQTWLIVGLLLFSFGESGSCHKGESKNSSTAKTNASSSSNASNSNSNDASVNKSKDMNKSAIGQGNGSDDGETWGGEHVNLVMKSGGADLEFDCAHGKITAPVKPNAQGHFDLQGTFHREGGPVRLDGPTAGQPVRYVGQMNNDTITFQIHFTSPDETSESFTLTRGREGRLRKCR
jgi:hypothetical protein